MQKSANAPKTAKRKYSPSTIKIIFGLSGNKCAAPDCSNPIIKSATSESDNFVLGHICHIYAFSDKGPRGKPGLSEAEKNLPDNLILCCPTHHAVVDRQYESYPATLLLEWKENQERAFRDRLSGHLNQIGYAELEIAAKALLSEADSSATDTLIIPPKNKIAQNGLSPHVATLLRMGAAKSHEVSVVLIKAAQLDPRFPDRLRNGFVSKYDELKAAGFEEDALFFEMYEWAANSKEDRMRQATGLCVLSHLFIICDVFEKHHL